MPKIIVFEGPDGGAKTALSKYLADYFGYLRIWTPEEPFRSIRHIFDKSDMDYKVRFGFYSSSVLFTNNRILNELQDQEGILIDRFTASLWVYHNIMDPGTDYKVLVDSLGFLQPDLEFIMTADDSVLIERMQERYQNSSIAHREQNPEFLAKVAQSYRNIKGDNIVHIDTSGNEPKEQILKRAIGYIKELR